MAEEKIDKATMARIPNEDADAVLRGLENEKVGYEQKLKTAKDHGDTGDAKVLEQGLKDVGAEIARIKKSGVTDRKAAATKLMEREAAAAEELVEVAEASNPANT